jgi:hypothetical protein
MKRINKFFSLSVLSTVVATVCFTYSCKKDRIQNKQLNAYSPVNTYLDSKKQAEQEFVIDSSGSGPIIGNQGTKIIVGKECLMFPNGDSVTWPFTVKLVELYAAKDMIYYQQPTVASSNTNILKTDGEIRLRAFKNGTELVLKPDPCYAAIEMPSTLPKTGMRVFYGFGSGSASDWTDVLSTLGITSSLSPFFSSTTTGYQAPIARLGWINCGILAGATPAYNLTFTSSVDDLTNVGIFIYFTATKTAMQAYNSVSGSIPTNSVVKIVAIAVDASGNLFSYYLYKNVGANEQIDVTMSATTDAALTALLDGL